MQVTMWMLRNILNFDSAYKVYIIKWKKKQNLQMNLCVRACVCVCAKLDSNQFNNMLRDKTLFFTVIMSD